MYRHAINKSHLTTTFRLDPNGCVLRYALKRYLRYYKLAQDRYNFTPLTHTYTRTHTHTGDDARTVSVSTSVCSGVRAEAALLCQSCYFYCCMRTLIPLVPTLPQRRSVCAVQHNVSRILENEFSARALKIIHVLATGAPAIRRMIGEDQVAIIDPESIGACSNMIEICVRAPSYSPEVIVDDRIAVSL